MIAAALLAAFALGFVVNMMLAGVHLRLVRREQAEREHAIRIEEKLRAHGIFQNYLARVKDTERMRAEYLASPLPKRPRLP